MKRILVAAAVIRREGKILIAERPADKHQGGLWEFPGGKVEPGESVQVALARELEEELGIVPTQARPLIRITHDYPDKSVCLDVWEVAAFTGEPRGREGQLVRWVSPPSLSEYRFPAANLPILAAARLPSLYFITPDDQDESGLLDWLEEKHHRGATLVLLRQPSWPRERYLAFAAAFLARCREHGIALMLHGDAGLLDVVPADGLHLLARLLSTLTERPVPATTWLAASVHDAGELARAEAVGVDFVTLSPVQTTLSHPDAALLGWPRFSELALRAKVPVFALGGLTQMDVETAWRHGAQGVAGIRGM